VLDEGAQSSREAADIRHMSEDVVRGHEVGPAASAGDLAPGFGPEELNLRRDTAGAGRLGHVRGRLDAEHRDAGRPEVLKEIAVVAGYLGDQAVRSKAQTSDHRLRVPLRMRDP